MNDRHDTRDGSGEISQLQRAKEVFLSVRSLRGLMQEEAIDSLCHGESNVRNMVLRLLRGDAAPLPVESLADNIRAVQALHDDMQTQVAASDAPAEASPGVDPDGTRVGRYRLLERIGEGGFGVVFMAEQQEPVRRRVALKIIKLGMDTRQVVARFEAERQALAMMDHPCIARVFDAGATPTGRPYFVMELVRGLPITEYCDQRSLDIPRRLALFAQVCEAIQHAHQKGIIHRDIKPSNVLVTEVGETALPKVIDFGIAKATNASLTDKTLFTEMRQMIGTPEYMSPEQAAVSAIDIDTRTDVYSLGVLLYELLAGTTPFDSKRLRSAAYGELQRIIREEDPPRPSLRISGLATGRSVAAVRGGIEQSRLGMVLRGELDWVVMKCLEKDRTRRYDSAGALMRDVQRFVHGEAVQAVPPSIAYRCRTFVRRNRGPVFAGALLSLALVGGLAGTSLGYWNANTQRNIAVEQRDRADRKTQEARRLAYSTSMLMACAAQSKNSYSVAKAALENSPEQCRGWEWRVLQASLDTSTSSIACPMPELTSTQGLCENQLMVHPDGRSFFAVRGYQRDAIRQVDLATGARLLEAQRPGGSSPTQYDHTRAQLTADGKQLVLFAGSVGGGRRCTIAVWDLQSGRPLLEKDLPPASGPSVVLAAMPDGMTVLTADSASGELCVEDFRIGKVVARTVWSDYRPHYAWVSRDGSVFACTDATGVVRIAHARTLEIVATLHGHTNLCHGMEFSSDGKSLATASLDRTARVWDLTGRTPTSVVLEHPCGVESVCFSPDGTKVATAGTDLALRVWNARSAELSGVYNSGSLVRGALMFMPDGRTIAGREGDGTVRFWDISADSTVNLRGHRGYINAAAFALDDSLVVSAGWDGWRGEAGCVRLWDASTGDPVAAWGKPGEVAYSLTVSRDGRHAAVSITQVESAWTPADQVYRNRIEILNLAEARRTVIENGKISTSASGDVHGLALSPDGSQLAVTRTANLEMISVADPGKVRRCAVPSASMRSPAWSNDGRLVACASGRDSLVPSPRVVVFDSESLEVVHDLAFGEASALTFSPDGRSLFIGTHDGLVREVDLKTGKAIHSVRAHTQQVNHLSLNADATRLASVGGDEGDIIVWDTTSWDRVALFHANGFVGSADWDRSGERLLCACDQVAKIWDAVSLRDRVQLREQRAGSLAGIEPRIRAALNSGRSIRNAADSIREDTQLPQGQRNLGHQLLLKSLVEGN